MVIRSKMFSRSVASAQKRVEGNNYDMRKSVLQYDDVMNKQRELIYGKRNNILDSESIHEEILKSMYNHVADIIESHLDDSEHLGEEDEEQVTREEYGLIDGISIDFGVMQRTRKAYVIKGDFKWDDIGSFNALSRYLNQYRNNNKISNNVYIQDCENCSIFGGDEKLIIGFGVKDLVVVDAGDVILVMDKDKDQEIKHLLNDINDSPEFGAFI